MEKAKKIDKAKVAQAMELVAGCGMIVSVTFKSAAGVYLSGCIAAAGIGIVVADMFDYFEEES